MLLAGLAAVDSALATYPLEPLGAGLDYWTFALGEDLVARCPQRDEGAANIEVEQRVLPLIAHHLDPDLAIPITVAMGPNPLGPGRMAIARRVPGEILGGDDWIRRGMHRDDRVANDIARLITAVHAVPVRAALDAGVRVHRGRAQYHDERRMVQRSLLRLLTPETGRLLLADWDSFLGDDENFLVPPCLTHADISLDHLLVVRTTGTPSIGGLIDFGDLQIADPDIELGPLLAEAGDDLVGAILAHQGRALTPALTRKLTFFGLADIVHDALWALDNGVEDLLAESLAVLGDRYLGR